MAETSNLFNVGTNRHRLTQKQKNANDKQWYKDQADLLDKHSYSRSSLQAFGGISDHTRRKVNYDLFNNIIDTADFTYVCQPFGAGVGELPANFTNRDIVSGKIKVLLGMEMNMPFSWKILATNEEATTRKEKEEFDRIKHFVVSEVMRPIQQDIQMQKMQETKGKELTPEEKQQIQAQIAEETQAQTPDEVRRYMTREHQDPAEVMSQQILQYLIPKETVADKFNTGFKHLCLGGTEVYGVGIFNGEPGMSVVNALNFECDKSSETEGIEDGEWARAEYPMTPSEVMSKFTSQLDDDEIDRIYQYQDNPSSADFTFSGEYDNSFTIKVRHFVWKSLQKIGFLTYIDRAGKEQLMLVDENYKINKRQGDIDIQWEWIPETHECWKILDDIYVYARPVQGQHRDLDNLYTSKLSYYGASIDCLNSPVTAPMDRMKGYQYYYDVVMYRIELLMASDKGKILAMNINAIPKSAGIDTAKFMYFMEANHLAFFNPTEEGNKTGGDVTNMVKEIDLSLASDIMKYISFAEYLEKKCGSSIGVTPQMEAAIGPDEAVTNTKQNIIQASYIIKPYFQLHNIVKGKVLQALVDTAKVAYSQTQPRKLSYVLDDMSVRMLTTDPAMLENSTYGLFMSNAGKAEDAKNAIIGLAQTAMQAQQVDLLDVIKVIKSDNMNQAEEELEVGMAKKQEQLQAGDKAKTAQAREAMMRQDTQIREQWEHEEKMLDKKIAGELEKERIRQTISALGFGEDKDLDDDGTPDVIEVMKFGLDADIKGRQLDQADEKLALERDKLKHQKQIDNQKIIIDRKKANKPSSSK